MTRLTPHETDMPGLVRIEVEDTRTLVRAPTWAGPLIRQSGGRWNPHHRCWTIPPRRVDDLVTQLETNDFIVRVVTPDHRPPLRLRRNA